MDPKRSLFETRKTKHFDQHGFVYLDRLDTFQRYPNRMNERTKLGNLHSTFFFCNRIVASLDFSFFSLLFIVPRSTTFCRFSQILTIQMPDNLLIRS